MRRLFLAGLVALLASSAQAADIKREPFGATKVGVPVEKTILRNDLGMTVAAIDYGATLTMVSAPDRAGRFENVILNLPSVAAYEATSRRWASVIGRYAGRITDARITVDGKSYALPAGNNHMTLHGGPNGYDKRVWTSRPVSDARSVGVAFELHSPDGDQGFPGALDLTVTYRLMRKANELRIEYVAKAAAPTVLNLTNHGFLNLAGAESGDVRDQTIWLDADRYAEVDGRKAPSGKLLPVEGTVLDFRKARREGEAMKLDDPLLSPSQGFDHSLAFRAAKPGVRAVAWMEDPVSGRRVTVLTDQPSVQINSGNGFDGTEKGPGGATYPKYGGFAFETQHLPDSPNQPAFPSTKLRPGRVFKSTTILRFSR
uniref:aldose epimerase family protein n=1 Tax=uncultured Caulobacter sp. TaxID=158749 RepID=UPI0025FD2F67|nr:aldose epimerase family protein [uncultured Caulobacter sp.]